MKRPTAPRPRFLFPTVLALVVATALSRALFATQQNDVADLVVLDAAVMTMDGKRPGAEAFAVRDGKFLAVGSSAEMRRYVGPTTTVWTLTGKTVVPGFNDAHLHPSPVYPEDSPYYRPFLGPPAVRTMDDLIAALKRKAARVPKGNWVTGSGFQDTKLGRWPTRYDLDKVSTEHPILITHSSGHVSVANSYALERAKITKDTPNPPGGEIGHDASGEPNGFLGESARGLLGPVRDAAPMPQELIADPSIELNAYALCLRQYAARGITSIGIAGTSMELVEKLQTLRNTGRLPVRVNAMLRERDVEMLTALRTRAGWGDE